LRILIVILCLLISSGTSWAQQLLPVVFNQVSGIYNANLTLVLSHPDPNVEIPYTINGNEPTLNDLLYSGPLTLENRIGDPNIISEIPTNPSFNFPIGDYSTSRANNRGWLEPFSEVYKLNVIRAKAFKTGVQSSDIVTHSYLIDPNGASLYTMPILSMCIDSTDLFSGDSGIYVYGNHPDGNYTRKGDNWERIADFELFDINGTSAYQQEVRVRMHGGGSRHSAKKNWRIYGEYEDQNNFNHEFFPDSEQDKFKRILLRSGGHRPDCFPRDDLGNLFTKGLNADQQHYLHVIVFVNGEYWGVHSIKERADNYFFQNLYGIDDNFITVLDQEFDLQGGGHEADSIEMANLENHVSTMDMTIPANYDYVKMRVDIENYIDYMASEIFLSNQDWVYSNVVIWRKTGAYDPMARKGQDGKFRWMIYDLDGAFGGSCDNAYYTANTLEDATVTTGIFSSYSRFFRGMLSSPEFHKAFVNRTCDLLNSHFKENVLKDKLTQMYNILTPEMPETVDRWRYPSEASNLADRQLEVPALVQWDTVFYYLDRFADRRPRKLREHMMNKWMYPDSSRIAIDVNDVSMGQVKMNTIMINSDLEGVSAQVYPWNGVYMNTVEVPIIAVPYPGFQFVEWANSGNVEDTLIWNPNIDTSIVAVFAPDPNYQSVVINEVMPSNSVFYADNFQEYDDWLELYNPNTKAINLSNCSISKNGGYWTIPEGTIIEANGYLIIWHDNESYQGDDHANFRLTNAVETIFLNHQDGNVMDAITYPTTGTDESFGRYPNGSSSFMNFTVPTPNFSNNLTGTTGPPKGLSLKAYPNPTEGMVYFNKSINFVCTDVSGRVITTKNTSDVLDLSAFAPGIYILTTDQKETIKLIVN